MVEERRKESSMNTAVEKHHPAKVHFTAHGSHVLAAEMAWAIEAELRLAEPSSFAIKE
jgi:hypothetical protein